MCVGMISKVIPLKDFQGYVDEQETSEKIIKNVFKLGDSAFLSGVYLLTPHSGYVDLLINYCISFLMEVHKLS